MTTSIPKMKPRGSRKKQPEEDSMDFFEVPSGFEFSKPPSQRAPPPALLAAPVSVLTRQPTANEAALSAKNYRLAKELSDLRVRHREECQKTAKLTMENMSLASRCREAISHVAMLQRELDIHRTRDAEALALQRQQTQKFASSLSDRQQFDANGRDALPVPPKKSASPMPPLQNNDKTMADCTPPGSRLSSSTSTSAMEIASDDNTLEKSRDESFQSSFVSPASSPEVSINDSNYIFTPSPNAHNSSPQKRDTPLYSSPTREVSNSPTQERLLPQPTTSPVRIPMSPSRKHRRNTSRDVFDASFASTFPSNFHSPPGEEEYEEESQSSTKADVYDPFSTFASPNSMAAVVRHAQVDTASDLGVQLPTPTNLDSSEKPSIAPMVSWEDEEVSTSSSFSTPPRRRPGEESIENEPPKTPAKTPSIEAREKYESAMAPAIRQQTPPRPCRPGNESQSNSQPPEPPVKTPSAEARSKYDFALNPRENTPSSIESLVQGAKQVGPSPLLQRIQQKRKQKKLNRQQSEPSSTIPKPDFRRYNSAPESRTVVEGSPSMIAENRDGSIVLEDEAPAPIASRSRRRSVKQPISYAEPALNTKIRKGHVFFQKDTISSNGDGNDVEH